jgi:hypothetical protein
MAETNCATWLSSKSACRKALHGCSGAASEPIVDCQLVIASENIDLQIVADFDEPQIFIAQSRIKVHYSRGRAGGFDFTLPVT